MTAASTARLQPQTENYPTLFALQRELILKREIVDALPRCAQILGETTGANLVVLWLSPGNRGSRGTVAFWPETEYCGEPDFVPRLGRPPCGLALEQEIPVAKYETSGEFWIEAPVMGDGGVLGAVSLRFSAGVFGLPGAKSSEPSARDVTLWTSYLLEEALALRHALSPEPDESTNPPLSTSVRSGIASYSGLVGNSDPMREVYGLIDQVAGTEATVLVTGESGTGKELVARAIHERSGRRDKPFIAVNCAALPESIIESELFGHERGSFTGAVASRQGRFELARGGTLFLDEIGDLSPSVQVKLLRILQERSFERVGGTRSIRTDARIIAATHRDLQLAISEGRFREDLYFRLAVFPIHIPPLRERGADILLLADHFAERAGTAAGKPIRRISSPALDLLMIYHWPGNVRELENCIARAAILSRDGVIHAYNLPPSLQSPESTGTQPASTWDSAIARTERELLVEALKTDRGNSAAAARRLGLTERRFRLALSKYKIDYRGFRTKL